MDCCFSYLDEAGIRILGLEIVCCQLYGDLKRLVFPLNKNAVSCLESLSSKLTHFELQSPELGLEIAASLSSELGITNVLPNEKLFLSKNALSRE